LIAYLLAVVFALAVGFFLYITVERPCMDKSWPSKVLRRIRGDKTSAIPLTEGVSGE
jgi:hypothetical protein